MLMSQEMGSGQQFVGRFFRGLFVGGTRRKPVLRGTKAARFSVFFTALHSLRWWGRGSKKEGGNVAFNVYGNNYLYIDMSDVAATMEFMRGVLTQANFEKLMYRTFAEVGRRSRTLIAREVRKEYEAPYGWVQGQIQHFKLGFGGAFPVTCTIPISSAKGVIGPRFKLSGRKRRISARIVKGQISVLPNRLPAQGGNPPFVVGGTAFTRRTKQRFPIVRVVGLAVPQMPMNRAAAGVQTQLLNYTAERLEHNFVYMFSR